jgi:hypothetical protein
VGFFSGAVTLARCADIKFNYDQVVLQVGDTSVTRSKLAEFAIAQVGEKVMPVLKEQAILDEGLRRAGVSVTDAEIEARIGEFEKYADNNLVREQLNSYPRPVLRDKLRSILAYEKAIKLSVKPSEAEGFYVRNPQLFFTPPVAKLVAIVTSNVTDAKRAVQRLRDGEDAKKLSALMSTNPKIKAASGDVGWKTKETVNNPALKEAIFDANDGKGLQVNQCTEPILIETPTLGPDGKEHIINKEYWVVTVSEFVPSKAPRFEDVKDVATFLARGEKLSTQMPGWINDQKKALKTYSRVKELGDPASPLEAQSLVDL